MKCHDQDYGKQNLQIQYGRIFCSKQSILIQYRTILNVSSKDHQDRPVKMQI